MSVFAEPVAGETATFTTMPLSAGSLRALERMGISIPTPIQAAALPAMMEGRDVVAQARTGSGKTLAFGLPAVEFADPRLRLVQVLVLVPTRELAVQVAGVLRELGSEKGLDVATIYGGIGVGPQRTALKRGVQIVVGTPGRVLDLLDQGALRLDKVRLLVLDEADEMLDFGFAPDVERIISRTTPDRQTALFSATVPEWVGKTAAKHMVHPVAIEIPVDPDEAPAIENLAFDLPEGGKLDALKGLLDARGEGAIIVFGRTKRGVARLAKRLVADGYPVAALQGNLSQNARDRVMAEFRSGDAPVLVATNVAARGIDVSNVEQVINVELPESSALLTHRVGRTGRMGRSGQAITLLEPEDYPKWRKLERDFASPIHRMPWPGADEVVAGNLAERFPAAVPAAAANGGARRRGSAGRSAAFTDTAVVARAARPAPGRFRGDQPAEARAPRNGNGLPAAANGNGGGDATTRAERSPAPAEHRGAAPRRDSRPAPTFRPAAPVAPRPGYEWTPLGEGESRRERPARAAAPEAGAESASESGARRGRGPRGRFPIVCSRCGQASVAPFAPDPTRPVFCDDCFKQRQEERRGSRD